MGGIERTTEELTLLYTEIMEFLKHSNVDIMLFYGSLLGYIRDGKFINMDNDVDVITSRRNFNALKKYAINNIKKYENLSFGIIDYNIFQINYKNLGPFDIYAFDFINGNEHILINWESSNPSVSMFKFDDIFPTNIISLNDYNIHIPNKSERILLQTYGDTWKVPLLIAENENKKTVDSTYKNTEAFGAPGRLQYQQPIQFHNTLFMSYYSNKKSNTNNGYSIY
jgi:hypothetical protein